MSNKLFAQNFVVRNARQSHSRGYGRPKTRSPFPNNSFTSSDSNSKRVGQIICVGSRALQEQSALLNPLLTHDENRKALIKSSKADKNVKVTPMYKGISILSQKPKPKLAQHHFSSLTREESNKSSADNVQRLAKADSIDIESSYKLTFYNPKDQNKTQDEVTHQAEEQDYGFREPRNQMYEQFIRRYFKKETHINDLFSKASRTPVL